MLLVESCTATSASLIRKIRGRLFLGQRRVTCAAYVTRTAMDWPLPVSESAAYCVYEPLLYSTLNPSRIFSPPLPDPNITKIAAFFCRWEG